MAITKRSVPISQAVLGKGKGEGEEKKKMRKRKRCDLIASREKRAENPSPTTSTDGNACA